MDITRELKRRFCKNCNIPINLFEEPYFTNRLQLLDKQYGTKAKYSRFLGSIEPFKTEQEYYEHYNGVKDAAIFFIKSSPEYNCFNNVDLSELDDMCRRYPITSNSIYKPSFDRMRFISIDMKHANFNAIRHFSPAIFGNADTWEVFMRKFTDDQHIIESKYVRQVILGNCNPKRHIGYERMLMYRLFLLLVDLIENDIVSLSNDEIIIRDNGKLSDIKERVWQYEKESGLEFKVETFKLHNLGDEVGYMKLYNDMSYKLKCVDNDYIHMIIRYMERGEILNEDLYFYYKHTLAIFDEVPKCIRESKPLQCYHAYLVKQVLIKKLENFFGVGDEEGTYFYNLTRCKSAFGLGTMSIDDFEEITDEQIDELATYVLEMEDYSL